MSIDKDFLKILSHNSIVLFNMMWSDNTAKLGMCDFFFILFKKLILQQNQTEDV